MTKLSNLLLNENDFITSDKLLFFCMELNNKKIQYVKTDFIKKRLDENIVSNEGWRGVNNIIELNEISILVTGHSDHDISLTEWKILENPNIKKWFCENKNIQHPKLVSLPIGITNKDEPNSFVHSIIGNTNRIIEISKTNKTIRNLVYMNFSICNFPEEREKIYHLYKNKSWVTVGTTNISENGHQLFLEDIYSHKFCFAPRGAGIDTHRLWESLYLRTIPIVKKCIAMEDFFDLPILFVDNWENLTEDFLNEKYNEIMQKDFPLEKIKIDFWLQYIKQESEKI